MPSWIDNVFSASSIETALFHFESRNKILKEIIKIIVHPFSISTLIRFDGRLTFKDSTINLSKLEVNVANENVPTYYLGFHKCSNLCLLKVLFWRSNFLKWFKKSKVEVAVKSKGSFSLVFRKWLFFLISRPLISSRVKQTKIIFGLFKNIWNAENVEIQTRLSLQSKTQI